ncbi:MAG: hypothetical protein JWS10_2611 [Cypionkella sp.]|nr:hypothetical protein [Cypionkella sp.]
MNSHGLKAAAIGESRRCFSARDVIICGQGLGRAAVI